MVQLFYELKKAGIILKNQYWCVYLCSWLTHSKYSLECQLLSSLLLETDKQKIKIYLRLRKYILQLSNMSMLDQIVLKHQDLITIVHRMFPESIRRQIITGIKKIFISFKVSNAKIYASVFIEYILSIYDTAQQQQQSIMAGQHTNITSQIAFSNFSSIVNFNSNLHRQNGLFLKSSSDHGYAIIETKFIPKQHQSKKIRISCKDQNNSYNNSFSYKEQKSKLSIEKNSNYLRQKQNLIQNQRKYKANNSLGSGNQMKIEDEQIIEQKLHQQNCDSRLSQNEFDRVMFRNKLFKDRILSSSNLQSNLSLKEEQSINETINIIHNSIVRNHRSHLC